MAQTMSETVHTYAGNPLDRGESLRRSEETIAALAADDTSLFLPFHKLEVANDGDGLCWLERAAIPAGYRQEIFLGTRDNVAHFAVDLPEVPTGLTFTDCRSIAAALSTEETGIVAQARAQLEWHHRNPFCALCGAPSQPERGGQIRRCTSCESYIHPRTDPVAIMLVVDEPGGNRCLLGRPNGRLANSNFFTALAGFLDQGESIEEAVRREVWEEAGIRVGAVRYHSSQPWPFSSQLMIGCHAVAETHEIRFDPVEMADVQWFSRAEAGAAVDQATDAAIRVPGAMAIAHHLIRSWVQAEVEL
ncbi:MAG: NAD(+) diphosphatase [Gammaproteobacteria bacterium]|nr:NAD(+) diphosphatase [Gammaproteobacteria bacterium]